MQIVFFALVYFFLNIFILLASIYIYIFYVYFQLPLKLYYRFFIIVSF